jgi:predicted alpha-1,2-mannosidase
MKKMMAVGLLLAAAAPMKAQKPLTSYVNPFLGTAPLTNPADIGFKPRSRVWAGLTFPGASVPNAMVQLSPITKFGSGAGYEYENSVIHAFTHTNKGHWNLCHIPLLPVTGDTIKPDDFGSSFSHKNESASAGYYQVFLERYGINAELTSTLRCGYHKYTYQAGKRKRLIVNLRVSNERVTGRDLAQDGGHAFKGFQNTPRDRVFFYAVANHKITSIAALHDKDNEISVVNFADSKNPLEIKIGLSFVSTENAKLNLEKELAGKSFDTVKNEAAKSWENLLSRIQVTGGTERQKELFYSCLYRSFLWPALRSDVNGEFTDAAEQVAKKNFRYYTIPSLWDDYRNKLVLLGMLEPEVTNDVIQSMIDRGEHTGFMPIFFHGDHAAPFISGSYLRGLRGYDINSAYRLLLKNATVEGRARPFLAEYIQKGYVATPHEENPQTETRSTAGVTKTLEYAYDDYAVALLARELKDEKNYQILMKRAGNYKNVFDPSTGLMRGRLPDGSWVKKFNPEYPYYEYMYREANAWQSAFFAPHDTQGLIALYGSKEAFEGKLDQLFSLPWNENYIAENINSFIGQYCHGNQPDHGFPYLYHFVGKPEKSQAILDAIMARFYGMGEEGLALCGMDDAGEMSSWYVFSAIGLYPYSPADADYIISVPIFDEVKFKLDAKTTLVIQKKNSGKKISGITYDGRKIEGWFVPHQELAKGKKLIITTQ